MSSDAPSASFHLISHNIKNTFESHSTWNSKAGQCTIKMTKGMHHIKIRS